MTTNDKTVKVTEEYTPDEHLTKTTKEHQSTKTGWDKASVIIQGFGSLAIPIAIAGLLWGVYQFNAQQQSTQHQALDEQQQMTLQTYLDDMTKLLFDDKLGSQAKVDKAMSAEAAVIARSKTIIALSRLTDPQRKAAVVEFLYESHLIGYYDGTKKSIQPPIVDLSGANLSGANMGCSYLVGGSKVCTDLSGANLSGANLSGANLNGVGLTLAYLTQTNLNGTDLNGAFLLRANLHYAVLYGAHLNGTDLGNANLTIADLRGAHLNGADLAEADLTEADLSGADLSGADLSGANLLSAVVTSEQLAKAKSLKGVTMPDGSIHP